MTQRILTLTGCVLAAALVAKASLAAKPSFDCSRVQSRVEQAICADPALASLDRKLFDVYGAASAKASRAMARRLREDQRGWVKVRDDCWKADGHETWITASWTVRTVQSCIEAHYRLRITQLQATWRLLPARTVWYACQESPANEIVVHFFATEPPTLQLERGDGSTTLWRVGSPSDDRFEGPNVSVSRREGELQLSRLNIATGQTETLQCRPK
jgi:uncharacterized protein